MLETTAGPARGPLLSYENSLLALLCLTFGMVFWNRLALNYMLPFVQADLGLNNFQSGLLVSILSASWAVAGLLVGAYSDRSGKRKTLLIVLTVALCVTALLAGMAASFMMLLLARLAMGAVQGPVLPIAQSTMAMESSPQRRGLNMGLLQNLGSGVLANIVAPVAIVAIAAAYGWRAAFLWSALPGIGLALLLYFFMRPDTPPAAAPAAAERAASRGFAEVLHSRNAILCLAITCLMVMWLMIQMTFLPGYMLNTVGLSSSEMSVQMSVRGISGLVAGIALPALSDRLGRKPVVIGAALFSAISPLWVALAEQSVLTLTLSGLLMGIGAGCLPLSMAIVPSETVAPRLITTALALIMGAAELVGGFLAPVAAGAVADAIGFWATFGMAGAAAIAAGLLGSGLKETRRRMPQSPPSSPSPRSS
jgi:predicted MFS family arabinose efflux permease